MKSLLLVGGLLGSMFVSSGALATGGNCNSQINWVAQSYSNLLWAQGTFSNPMSWSPYFQAHVQAKRGLQMCQNGV